MEKLSHIWNVNQFMTKLDSSLSRSLQPFYIRTCKKMSKGAAPKQNFGNTKMCPHCGSLWSTIDYKARLSPGRPIPKSVRKIIKAMNENEKKVPKVRRSLAKKCLKNQTNRLLIRCSVCMRRTVIYLSRPKREKVPKITNSEIIKASNSQKKKKKRTKDKTAGLNISGNANLCKDDNEEEVQAESVRKVGGNAKHFITSTPKIKKLNIAKLKDMVTQGTSVPKTQSLHKFLTEL